MLLAARVVADRREHAGQPGWREPEMRVHRVDHQSRTTQGRDAQFGIRGGPDRVTVVRETRAVEYAK